MYVCQAGDTAVSLTACTSKAYQVLSDPVCLLFSLSLFFREGILIDLLIRISELYTTNMEKR